MFYQDYRKKNSMELSMLVLGKTGYTGWWDYVTALRGMDKADFFLFPDREIVKSLFTCFIRGGEYTPQSQLERGTGSLDIFHFEASLKDILELRSHHFRAFLLELKEVSPHYKAHVIKALTALRTTFEDSDISLICDLLIEIMNVEEEELIMKNLKAIAYIISYP